MDRSEDDEVTLSTGDVIGEKYRVEEEIGSGGMGIVVSARHVAMGHRLAIKILRLDDVPDGARQAAVTRFFREARAAARIESDHVVRVIDVAALPDGTPYMVMEYLEGEDLRGLLRRRGPIPVEEAIGYILQACEGLAQAHVSGVIHRDLKPSNLFLARKANGTTVLKVLDFGISKVASRPGEVAITTTDSLVGSPLYMAPEQMRSSKDVDVRADVWSLGLILFELLSGTPAFEGETVPEVCVSVMNGTPLPMSHFRDDVPEDLNAILLRCMEKDRERRHPNMGTLARALERFAAQHLRVHAERASATLKTPRLVEIPPEMPEVTAPMPSSPERVAVTRPIAVRARRRKTPAWLLAGAGACVVAAVAGGFFARGAASEVPAPPPATASLAPPPAPPEPVAAPELAAVPVDSLPTVAHDAGPPRVTSTAARRPAPSAPTASASAGATQKDGWKWGDRN